MANANFAEISDAAHIFKMASPLVFDNLSTEIPLGTQPTEFVYNHYVFDESVDDDAKAAKSIKDPDPNAKPRFARLSFGMPAGIPVDNRYTLDGLQARLQYNPPLVNPPPYNADAIEAEVVDGRLQVSSKMIANEISLQAKPNFAKLDLQDLNADTKLYNLVNTSAQKRIAQENQRVQNDVDALKENFLSRNFQSQTDLVKVLKRQVPASEDFISKAMHNLAELNETYIDEEEQKQIVQDNFEAVKRARFTPQISMKFISSLVSSAVTDPIGTYSEELTPLQDIVSQAQSRAISEYMPLSPGSDKTTASIAAPNLIQNPPDAGPTAIAKWQLYALKMYFAGYIIRKNEILPDNSVVEKEVIMLSASPRGTSQAREYIDFKVAYGRNYTYTVEALYTATYQVPYVTDQDVGKGVDDIATDTNALRQAFFVSSRRSRAAFVETIENIPPKPPESMKIMWDQESQGSLIMWNMPANPQRDIKRFQVLRRSSIQDPFELQIEIDFDQSVVKYPTVESVSRELKIKSKVPIYHYIDKNIDKGKSHIYTLRSIDAHGMISQYSEQIAVKYNRFTNRLDATLISTRGASAQYPNFNLISRMFSPTIKDSNHTRMKIYFDPEYLRLTNEVPGQQDPEDVTPKLFNFEGDGGQEPRSRFQLQVLNVDLQQSETIDILIPCSISARQKYKL